MCPLLDQGWPIAFYNISYLGHLLQWWKCGKKGAILRPVESLKSAYMRLLAHSLATLQKSSLCKLVDNIGSIWARVVDL